MRRFFAIAWVGLLAAAGCGEPPPGPADVTLELVEVPGGNFVMGCDAADPACEDYESPTHEIFLDDFEITKYEITQAQYQACIADQACSEPKCDFNPSDRGNYPVACASWQQASEFCAWAGLNLPTEAQWEKAARGDDGRKYPWGNEEPTCDHASFLGCSGLRQPVGSFPQGASPYGVMDMAGNVPEWVADWYSPTYYENAPISDPGGPNDGDFKVFRGGSFASIPEFLRTYDRSKDDPLDYVTAAHLGYLGIRCVR